ncbi:uncharacterized protein LOC107572638, partial [Tachysurus ichikawai]
LDLRDIKGNMEETLQITSDATSSEEEDFFKPHENRWPHFKSRARINSMNFENQLLLNKHFAISETEG